MWREGKHRYQLAVWSYSLSHTSQLNIYHLFSWRTTRNCRLRGHAQSRGRAPRAVSLLFCLFVVAHWRLNMNIDALFGDLLYYSPRKKKKDWELFDPQIIGHLPWENAIFPSKASGSRTETVSSKRAPWLFFQFHFKEGQCVRTSPPRQPKAGAICINRRRT